MKQTILMVVGSDMTGKTEISQALARRLDIKRFKASGEHDTYLNHQDKFLMQLRYADTRIVDFLRQTGCSVVFDRAYPCEWVYSKIFHRETDLDCLCYVDDEMAKMDARIIICHRSSYKGIVDDIDPTTKEERLVELDAAYHEFAEWTNCKTLLLNVDDENLNRELHDILTWMGKSRLICSRCEGEGDDGRIESHMCRMCDGTGWVYR